MFGFQLFGRRSKPSTAPVAPDLGGVSEARAPSDDQVWADIAQRFVAARRNAHALNDYPGQVPAELRASYAIQDRAIALWPEAIGGWKVGRIGPALQPRFGVDRLAGPIFLSNIWMADPKGQDFPAITGGFAAAEAEITMQIGVDIPAGARSWSLDQAREVIGAAYASIEFAGSPLATINELGPTVIVSDYGNNAGLMIGPQIADWANVLADIECLTLIDDQEVGRAKVGPLEKGPLESVRFLLENVGARGLPIAAGTFICTGAVTGVHDMHIGQTAVCQFGSNIVLSGRAVAAKARAA